ncbi:terminase large subunit [Acidipila sp. EB88]|uniref:terminase large subunit n=1 Tax=Acidipila sp. EB88 TaxID=2305226 RepID=UPI0013151C78|nr:terminase TerL endonuclease subunit [Acidipila sp. EB88]
MTIKADGRADEYIRKAVSGEIVVSRWVKMTCERHLRDLEDGHLRNLRFSPARAQHVINFIEGLCKHSDGAYAGRAFILQDWQVACLSILFGWLKADTKYRRFRYAFLELARGSGKSTLASAIALYLLIADGEPSAHVFCVATKMDQAKVTFGQAEKMVSQSPTLRKRLKSQRNLLSYPANGSKFQPLSSDASSLDGLSPSGCIIDELHAHKDRRVYDKLVTALGKRRQPLLAITTTSGFDRLSLCYELHTYSERVLTSVITGDDAWFSWIAGLSEDDDPFDEANWPKANPGLGQTVQWDELRSEANKARESPSYLNAFLTLRLNFWTKTHSVWMPLDKWDACDTPVDIEKLKGRKCFAGLDLSTLFDLSAFVLVFPPIPEDPHYYVLPYFWVPKDNIRKRSLEDKVPYEVWHRQGLLFATDGDVIDYDAIRLKIQELGKVFNIAEIAFDRWNATQITTQLAGDNFEMCKFGQGFASMGAPTKRLLEIVVSGQLAHGGNPILRWMAGNAVAKTDPSANMKLDKSKSAEKIDGLVAAIMALDRAEVHQPKPTITPSIHVW